MKRTIFSAVIIFIISLLIQSAAWATGSYWNHRHSGPPKVHNLADILKSGEIVGAVSFCGPEGTNGAHVDLVGESFQVILGAGGEFKLRYVPRGAYTLRVSIPGQPDHTQAVRVKKRKVTNVGEIALCPDNDGDGFALDVDCNDNNGDIFPGAEELCDGIDNDCNGEVDGPGCDCTDADNDGFFAQDGCGTAVDCNDDNDLIKPGAEEICDGVDNNCDNAIDEGFDLNTDVNNCGECSNVCSGGQCAAGLCVDVDGDGFTTEAGDCNDNDPSIFPGAQEICNGIDNDCNGQVDDNCSAQVCTESEVQSIEACFDSCGTDFQCQNNCFNSAGFSDQCQSAIVGLLGCGVSNGCIDPNAFDRQCVNENCPAELEKVFGFTNFPECVSGETRPCGTDVGECSQGTETCVGTLWSACEGSVGPTDEICDTLDNDCNGQVDENDVCNPCSAGLTECNGECVDLQTDVNHCSQCNQACGVGDKCESGVCQFDPSQCQLGDTQCGNECVNLQNDVNNCGQCGRVCNAGEECGSGSCRAADNDGDGFDTSVDCDDGNASINPGASETCNLIDDNCDGQVDEGGVCATCGNGVVEPGEECDGGGPCCNSDCTLASAGTVCRPQNGVCDVADACDGVTPFCPFDAFAAPGTSCGLGLECSVIGTCEQINCPTGQMLCDDLCLPVSVCP